MIDPLDEQARELNSSGFLSTLGGMAFAGLGYLLVAGLFVVYFGATQGSDGHTVRPVVVTVGWVLVALASAGNVVMLRRFLRFWKAVRPWVRQQLQRGPADGERTRLQAKITRSGRGRSFGPAAEFTIGSVFFVPFGFVLPYLALLFQVIGLVDTVGGSGARSVDWAFMLVALVPTLLAATLGALVLVGISTMGGPLRRRPT